MERASDAFFTLFALGLIGLMVVSMWKVFTKAGRPGWMSLIPILNVMVLLEIAGKPGWWLVLMFFPCVNLLVSLAMIDGLSRSFGRGLGFALGLLFLPPIFLPILAFSDDLEYVGA